MATFLQRTQMPQKQSLWSNSQEKLFQFILTKIHNGVLTVQMPSGTQHIFAGRENDFHANMRIFSWNAISRMLKSGDIGLAEGYMAGEWTTDDLPALLGLMAANIKYAEQHVPGLKAARFLDKINLFSNRNNRRGSRRNISFHYDLGNDFYQLWLDQSMTYSSALFDQNKTDIHEAQLNKYRRLATDMGIQKGDHIMEIGCGWGGFAEFAVTELNCKVTGLTLSQEQLDFARRRLDKTKYGDQAEFLLCDYRDISGQFDHVVSIEMMEAVGEEYWSQYFHTIKKLLRPGGRAGIQVITFADDRFSRYRKHMDFIQKYIFPGGLLPSDEQFKEHLGKAKLTLEKQLDFGHDYARTLAIWQQSFLSKVDEIQNMGFDDKFIKMWLFYLSYCEAGFRQENIDVRQYVMS